MEGEPEQNKPSEHSLLHLPRRSFFILVLCAVGSFFAGCELLYMQSFLNFESTSKGLSETQYGFIIGNVRAGVAVFSSVFGNYMPRIGPKFLYVAGFFITGSANLIFGFLDRSPSGTPFFVLCLIGRFVSAIGIAAHSTSRLTILATEFSSKISVVFGISETVRGIGLTVGPVFGGALYQHGGFSLPFYVVACVLLSVSLLLYLALPASPEMKEKRKGSIWSLLKSSLVLISLLSMFVSGMCLGFLGPTMIFHLEQFHLTTTVVGVVYMMSPMLYGVSSFIVGHLSNEMTTPGHLLIFSSWLCGINYIIFGPCPWFLNFEPTLWLAFLCPSVVGMSYAISINSGLKSMVQGAKEIGLPNNMETHALVSGVFYLSAFAGGSVGSYLGGYLQDLFGFKISSSVVGLISGAMGIINGLFFLYRWYLRKEREKDETMLLARYNSAYGSADHNKNRQFSIR